MFNHPVCWSLFSLNSWAQRAAPRVCTYDITSLLPSQVRFSKQMNNVFLSPSLFFAPLVLFSFCSETQIIARLPNAQVSETAWALKSRTALWDGFLYLPQPGICGNVPTHPCMHTHMHTRCTLCTHTLQESLNPQNDSQKTTCYRRLIPLIFQPTYIFKRSFLSGRTLPFISHSFHQDD